MPYCVIDTNVSSKNIPDLFLKELSKIVAETLGKPEKYVCVEVNADKQMTFHGSSDPCALVRVGSIGMLGLKENKKHTIAIGEKISKDLGLEKTRFYIQFIDIKPQDVAYNGDTFA